MKITTRTYATSLVEAALSQPEKLSEISEHFLQILRKNRQTKLLPKIISELEFALERQTDTAFGKAVFATTPSEQQLKEITEIAKKISGRAKAEITADVDKSLVAGFKLKTAQINLDNSVTGKLQRLKGALT